MGSGLSRSTSTASQPYYTFELAQVAQTLLEKIAQLEQVLADLETATRGYGEHLERAVREHVQACDAERDAKIAEAVNDRLGVALATLEVLWTERCAQRASRNTCVRCARCDACVQQEEAMREKSCGHAPNPGRENT